MMLKPYDEQEALAMLPLLSAITQEVEERTSALEILEEAKQDIQRRVESITQEFLRQQSVMDEQMRRLQNEKHELKMQIERINKPGHQQAA